MKKQSGGRLAIIRPHCLDLLEQLLTWQSKGWCRLAIWTTITESNAQIIVNQLLTYEQQKECLFVWCATHATPHPNLPFKSYKDLEKVWVKFPNFDKNNTTLFDDSEFKALKQPENIHKVATFMPHNKDDQELVRVKDYILQNLLSEEIM